MFKTHQLLNQRIRIEFTSQKIFVYLSVFLKLLLINFKKEKLRKYCKQFVLVYILSFYI